jgi:hypothetical protein
MSIQRSFAKYGPGILTATCANHRQIYAIPPCLYPFDQRQRCRIDRLAVAPHLEVKWAPVEQPSITDRAIDWPNLTSSPTATKLAAVCA